MRKLIALILLLGALNGLVGVDSPVAGTQFVDPSTFFFSPAPVSAHSSSRSLTLTASVAGASSLFVDAVNGNDGFDGLTAETAYRTLQKAADEAVAGTVIHVLPGVYRETVRPAADGTSAAPILYLAEHGPGTVTVRGSEPASSLSWTQLSSNAIGLPAHVDPQNVYYADLSSWALTDHPRFVVTLDGVGEVTARLPLAREPDWYVETDWRYHEFWWTADGGSDVSGCDPTAPGNDWNCDLAWRCDSSLTDRNAYPEPDPRIESGDLTSLGDLTGAELVSLDAKWGHYLYRRPIVVHDVAAGRVRTTGECYQDGGTSDPGLGWGSKYYVEDHPGLLDSPGEWWYDASTGRLYLWPSTPGNPASMAIEISRRDVGFDLTGRSYITLDGFTVELVNDTLVKQANYWAQKSHGNVLRDLALRYGNHGVFVQQSVRADQPADNVTRGFVLQDSEIGYIDTHGLFMSPWWDGAPDPATYPRSGIYDTTIRGNEFHHLGFGADEDNAVGVEIQFPDRITFEDNHAHDIAHNGVQFLWSVIDSDKTYDFSPDEIKTGEILVKDNLFEDTCQLTTDCGALKFWGQPPNNHVFRDVLVTGNTFRNVAAWTYVAQQRVGWWSGGEQCEVKGQAGFGLYLDYAAGIHAYRNLSYNNSYAGVMLAGTWRDGDLIFVNNTIADSLYGFRFSGVELDTHGGSVNTQVLNNIIANSEGYGIYQCTADQNFGNLAIDHNLYTNSGWRAYVDGGVWNPGIMAVRIPTGQLYYPTLEDVRNRPEHWETNGVAGDPGFSDYDPGDHDPYDGSWPNFTLTGDSVLALDAGTALPASLTALLQSFGLPDSVAGPAPDIGWSEVDATSVDGFFVTAVPASRTIEPGGTTSFVLQVRFAGSSASDIQLSASSPDPRFETRLSSGTVSADQDVSLVVTDVSPGDTGYYTFPITVTDGEVTQVVTVGLLVAESQVYMPLVTRRQPAP